MKYKLRKPEDYPEIESYVFKLGKAYGDLYSDMLMALVSIDTAIGVLRDENADKLMCEAIANVLEKFIKNYRDEN